MVSPNEVVESVARAISESGKLPDDMGVVLREADIDTNDADIPLPALELQISNVAEPTLKNSELTDFVVDGDGNRTGEVYYSEFELTIEINIWTNEGSGYDPDKLGNKLREALYEYSSHGPGEPLLDEEGNEIDTIYYVDIDDGTRVDDLLITPTARKWQQLVQVWACEEYIYDRPFVENVDSPKSVDFNDSDDDDVIENT